MPVPADDDVVVHGDAERLRDIDVELLVRRYEGSPMVQLKFLAGFCVIFTTACFLLFETVLNAE